MRPHFPFSPAVPCHNAVKTEVRADVHDRRARANVSFEEAQNRLFELAVEFAEWIPPTVCPTIDNSIDPPEARDHS